MKSDQLTEEQETRAQQIVEYANTAGTWPIQADDPMVAHRVDQLVCNEFADEDLLKPWCELDEDVRQTYREEAEQFGLPGIKLPRCEAPDCDEPLRPPAPGPGRPQKYCSERCRRRIGMRRLRAQNASE